MLLLWGLVPSLVGAQNGSTSGTYTNPILDTIGADPWVIRHDGWYYMTYTTATNITILRSQVLTDWNNADVKLAFQPPEGQDYSTDLWAPELHYFEDYDKWYIIFTADPNFDQPPPETDMYCEYNCPAVYHRMYVLESSSSDPWTSNYTFKAQLDTYDQFAIDGTYFRHSTGLYHIYSCWYTAYSSWPANLCITKMENPWTVSSNFTERQILSVPENAWEKTPYGRTPGYRLSSNEGPQQLVNPTTGQNFVIYSAARSDNRNYCLGQLELIGDDPMNNQDWRKRNEGCVFYQNALEHAYGVGHASFTTSPTADEDWIVYHGMLDPTNGWSARTIRTQKFTWNDDGTPNFPRPGYGPYQDPSGQNATMQMNL
ncbi:glycoside hydrolase family 43 protein [Polychaeton citri CBS 116435]|uniref:Glycoside hydrolase family 43 protein n=1 Tax=Polychaeton citri CBS 116435 TaxID=1314669 RepID=A0A9P4Q848_9PEZI|nr:glycoside hydrolase family 43 protein [Polychaeton citri CBS 116435]